jgi:hypothetical protein
MVSAGGELAGLRKQIALSTGLRRGRRKVPRIEGTPLLGPPYHGPVVRYCPESDIPSYLAYAPYPAVRKKAVENGWITTEQLAEDFVQFVAEQPDRHRRIAELREQHERFRRAGALRRWWLGLIGRDGLAEV